MDRQVLNKLVEWKANKNKKPLIIRGVRQVGKTWLVDDFSKNYESYVKIDFEKQPEFKQLFENTKNPIRLVENISFATGEKISENTLIFFDEIQCCSEALNSLKYFCEDAKQYDVIAAGSLLGIQLAKGFPVGKVDFIDLAPMTFNEFLIADNNKNLCEYIKNVDSLDAIPEIFRGPLSEKLRIYMYVGGMPEPLECWCSTHDINKVDEILYKILESYKSDFGKYAPNTDLPKINLIWNSLNSQLSKENKKFIYSVVKPGARAREYENAVSWLCDANLLQRVTKIKKPNIPLSAYEDRLAFKIYMSDVGLLRKYANITFNILSDNNYLFTEFKGSLTENFILQSLRSNFNVPLYYWANNNYEVDFVMQHEDLILPIEVKAGQNVASASLKNYLKIYHDESKLAIRFSKNNLCLDGKILNIPLFMVSETERLVDIALSNL